MLHVAGRCAWQAVAIADNTWGALPDNATVARHFGTKEWHCICVKHLYVCMPLNVTVSRICGACHKVAPSAKCCRRDWIFCLKNRRDVCVKCKRLQMYVRGISLIVVHLWSCSPHKGKTKFGGF